MSLLMSRLMHAEVITLEISFLAQLSTFTWSGIGEGFLVSRYLKKLAGTADIRSVPIDWASVVAGLRQRGWTGKLPRSLRRFEPPPDDFVKPWPEWPGDPPWYPGERP